MRKPISRSRSAGSRSSADRILSLERYTVRVPLSPTALELQDRYMDQPDGRLLPFICEQDYNRDIDEEMAKEVILKLE